MATVLEYMQLASRVYASSVNNVIDVPAGWRELDWQPDRYTGFSAGVYLNEATNEMVISYTGTNSMVADPLNWTAGLGVPAPQIYDAMAYYFAFREAYPTANITFTGHSLGGGLASLMAVMFDKQATVFDEAPFQLAAVNPALMPSYAAAMAAAGYVDDALVLFIASAGLLALTRESNVTQYYLEGEILNTIRFPADTLLGSDNLIALGEQAADSVKLHSMALMTALQYSPAFLAVVKRLPDLISQLLDTNLFATDSRNPDKNDLLRRLLRHQLGVTGDVPVDGMLDRFVADMSKVAQDGGFTLTNHDITNTLVAFAMQMYYENPHAAHPDKTLFASVTGGIRFDRTDVSESLFDAKGWQLYFQNYLAEELTLEEHQIVERLLPAATDWFVQASGLDMFATADAKKAFMVGGIGADWMMGGNEADLLLGNGGDDHIGGGKGNDTLIGGAGVDTYIINAGDGHDTILDSDGQGVINLGALLARGSATTGLDPAKWRQSGEVWQDQQNGITYTRIVSEGETRLLIKRGDASVLVRGWTDGQLGITLGAGAAVALPGLATSFHLEGDLQPVNPYSASGYDSYGNLFVTGIAAPNRADVLYDHEGNDHLQGKGGDDLLIAQYGDDDLLEGGAGFDFLMGGTGDDQLFGEDKIDDLAAYIAVAETQTGTGEVGDWLSGWDGRDTLVGGAGDDALVGGIDEDLLIGGAGNDIVYGDFEHTVTVNPDTSRTFNLPGTLASTGAADVVYGNAGNDELHGNQGNDILDGGTGNDTLYGEANDDVLLGGVGADNLYGDSLATEIGNDYLDGGAGADYLAGGAGDDVLLGREGDDRLEGDFYNAPSGNDYLEGGAGNDVLIGGSGSDVLLGGDGNDSLYGDADNAAEPGNDTLDGGAGADYLAGGAGDDTYLNVTGEDTVYDKQGNNTVQLAAAGLGAAGLSYSAPTLQLGVALDTGGEIRFSLPFFSTGSTTLQFANDDEIDLETLVGESLLTPLNLTLGSAGRLYGGAGADRLTGSAGVDTLLGHNGGDSLYGNAGADILDGGAGGDYLSGGAGDDTLLGGTGLDSLDGGDGADTLDGGMGSDYLSGGAGDDFYLFIAGGGQDTVYDPQGFDTIRFGEGVMPVDITFARSGLDMVLGINGSSDQLRIQNWGYANGYQIERVEFADGSLWDSTYLQAQIPPLISGTAGDDDLTAWFGQNTVMEGLDGDDRLIGNTGNDTLDGGSGFDTLEGGAGNDVYLLGTAFGHDTIADIEGRNRIEFAADITLESLVVERGVHDYQIYCGGIVSVPLSWAQASNELMFADGTYVLSNELFTGIPVSVWGDGDNNVLAELAPGSDFEGGRGDDTLIGGAGDNVYYFDLGDGSDAIVDLGGVDTLSFYEGITPDDVFIEYGYLSDQLPSLRVYVGWDGDVVSIQNGELGALENFLFSDGLSLTFDEMLAWQGGLYILPDGSTGDRYGEQLVVGTDGGDELYDVVEASDAVVYLGGLGNDSIVGNLNTGSCYLFNQGDGNDTIQRAGGDFAEEGVDAIVFGAGITPESMSFSTVSRTVTNYSPFRIPQVYTYTVTDTVIHYGSQGDSLKLLYDSLENLNFMFADGRVGTYNALTSGVTVETVGIGPGYFDIPQSNDAQPTVYWNGTARNDTYTARAYLSIVGQAPLPQKDYVDAGAGDDGVDTGPGNDWITGCSGNDVLSGGAGSDVYYFKGGDGQDSIRESVGPGERNYILIDGSDAPGAPAFSYDGSDLTITYRGGQVDQDAIEVKDFYPTGTDDGAAISGVRYVQYGAAPYDVFYSLGDIKAAVHIQNGTAGDDTLIGSDENDFLFGNAGADTVQGGKGDDTLSGGAGDDTYVINLGDGVDTIFDSFAGSENNTIVFGAGVDPGQVKLFQGSLGLDLGGGNTVHIEGVDYNDIANTSSIQRFVFADGITFTVQELLARGFDVRGGAGDDILSGTNVSDRIDGGAGDDTLIGGEGDDTLTGGTGADLLQGGVGNDVYVLNSGDGQDTIQDSGVLDANLIQFGPDILREDVSYEWDGTTLIVNFGASDAVRIPDFDRAGVNGSQVIVSMAFDDGSVLTLDELLNHAPVAGEAIAAPLATEDSLYQFAVPATAFVDTDSGDALSYVARLVNGDPLPDWLAFDAATRTFSGTPGNDHIGGLDIDLEVQDVFGLSAAQTFRLDVANVNDAPIVSVPIPEQNAKQGQAYQYALPVNTFTDVDAGDSLSYVVALEGGGPLPAWLAFDAVNRTFAGTPGSGDISNLNISVTATDRAGSQVSDSFTLKVNTAYNEINGTSGWDILIGTAGNDRIDGKARADVMAGLGGDDLYIVDNPLDFVLELPGGGVDAVEASLNYRLPWFVENLTLTGTSAINGTGNFYDNLMIGNSASNVLTADAGNDTLNGMGGNDTLTGGTGNDTYILGRGYGIDTAVENDAAAGNTDVAQFLSSVSADQIWFKKATNNLEVSIIGTSDKLVVKDWYLGNAYHVEQFKTTDGAKTLLDSNVQNLVNAMASFAPPAAGQTSLPSTYQTALAPVIAANWQ